MPADFESFILSCKSVHHAASEGLLERYNSFRQKYHFIRIQPNLENSEEDDECEAGSQGSLGEMEKIMEWEQLVFTGPHFQNLRQVGLKLLDLTDDQPVYGGEMGGIDATWNLTRSW